MRKKTIVLVIDGLGVGEFEVTQNTYKCNTLKSISKCCNYKNSIFDTNIDYHIKPYKIGEYFISKGYSKLAHEGADSFLGHKEIICDDYSSEHLYVEDFFDDIKKELGSKYRINFDFHSVVLNDSIVISNNVESDIGLNINVLGVLDKVSFNEICLVGKAIKKIIDPSRVIIMGGKPLDINIMRQSVISRYDSFTNKLVYGIKIPKTGIYNENYIVYHLTKDSKENIINRFTENDKKVALLGKTADMFDVKVASKEHIVNTEQVLSTLVEYIKSDNYDFIFANVQELDLAGHSQDVEKAAKVIDEVLFYLPIILDCINDGILIITADHGNDPLCGHSYHTREMVPIYVFSKEVYTSDIGTRETLSDIGASICKYNNFPFLERGQSFI